MQTLYIGTGSLQNKTTMLSKVIILSVPSKLMNIAIIHNRVLPDQFTALGTIGNFCKDFGSANGRGLELTYCASLGAKVTLGFNLRCCVWLSRMCVKTGRAPMGVV